MMSFRAVAAIVLATAAMACGEASTTTKSSDGVAGQYTLTGFDGAGNLPCCGQTDSAGTVVTTSGGLLEVDWNTPSGTYAWDVVRNLQYPNGTSHQIQSRFSSGAYTWDGQTLTLVDSAGAGAMTGSFVGGRLTVNKSGHQYAFLKLIQLPH